MATKIRLKRFGKIREPHYRVVVMDSRTKRDGRAIEVLGLGPYAGRALSFAVTVTFTWAMNRWLTFAERRAARGGIRLARLDE